MFTATRNKRSLAFFQNGKLTRQVKMSEGIAKQPQWMSETWHVYEWEKGDIRDKKTEERLKHSSPYFSKTLRNVPIDQAPVTISQ